LTVLELGVFWPMADGWQTNKKAKKKNKGLFFIRYKLRIPIYNKNYCKYGYPNFNIVYNHF